MLSAFAMDNAFKYLHSLTVRIRCSAHLRLHPHQSNSHRRRNGRRLQRVLEHHRDHLLCNPNSFLHTTDAPELAIVVGL